MRQWHVLCLVHRELHSIVKKSGHHSIQGIYVVLSKAREALSSDEPLLLPDVLKETGTTRQQLRPDVHDKSASSSVAKKRCGKGTHGLTLVRELMTDKENWTIINFKRDYQFPGFYEKEQNQSIFYTPNALERDQADTSNPHFMWDDIQLSKGKVNKDRQIFFEIDKVRVPLMYRCAPCNGIKFCPVETCNFVAPISQQRPCRLHPDKPLVKRNDSGPVCPVEFAYLYPPEKSDTQRWILGIVRHQKQIQKNIHNHPMPRPSKVCSMVKAVIQQSASSNSSLKPSQVAQGKGVPFVPGVVDEASSHIGRVAQVVKRARQKSVYGQSWDIANFETIADQIDTADERYASRSSDEMKKIRNLTRPYLVSAGIENGIRYILTMNPLMSSLLARAEFVEADITSNESREYPYLFNSVAFDDRTLEWAVVSRVRLDKQGAKSICISI